MKCIKGGGESWNLFVFSCTDSCLLRCTVILQVVTWTMGAADCGVGHVLTKSGKLTLKY